MATAAAFGLHRHMLVDERSLLIGMALVANRIAARQSPQLPYGGCPMRVMAVTALNYSLIDAVVIRLGEIRFRRGMAAVAELRRALDQQVFTFFGVMGRMAVQAAHVTAGMSRFPEMRLRMTVAVAS